MRIPWKLKSAAFAAFDVIGPRFLYAAQKHVTGRSLPRWRAPSPNWLFHRDHLAAHGARRIVEFGAGKSLAQNLYLATAMNRPQQVLVDLNPMLDIALVNQAIERLEAIGIPMNGAVRSAEELSAAYGISYLAPLGMQATPFAAGSFDACMSTNTLEHIPREAIAGIWKECRRILVPGGLVTARIDYSDHYATTDRSIGRLNYLRFTEQEWRRYNHASHFQNRLRHHDHLDLMRAAGLHIEHEHASLSCTPPPSIADGVVTGDPADFFTAGSIVAAAP